MNTFVERMNEQNKFKLTENGAIARNTTNSSLYDLFALGGAYRNRSQGDKERLFSAAYYENPRYAVRCLFYLRDCRQGQGERDFFRVCFRWLCQRNPRNAVQLLEFVPTYGRWDDLTYLLRQDMHSYVKAQIVKLIAAQLKSDIKAEHPSLLAKWMPSENASSSATKAAARTLRHYLGLNSKQYRVLLSTLRAKLNLVESQMSQDRWEEIKFDEVPSKAGLLYSKAFRTNDKTAQRYIDFITDKKSKVHAGTLYPSDVVGKAISGDKGDELAVNKFWENLPDYFGGKSSSMMCVCDTSGSMWGDPIKTSIALSMYAAQHNQGDFHNYFITFSSCPEFIKIQDGSFFKEARRIYKNSINDNTDLNAVFDLIYNGVMCGEFHAADIPKTLVVISDMEIDSATTSWRWDRGYDDRNTWTPDNCLSQMEKLRLKWSRMGLQLPKLVYWNVDARQDTILEIGDCVSLVSGKSPVLFEQICSGKTGYELMMDKLNSKRYSVINFFDYEAGF